MGFGRSSGECWKRATVRTPGTGKRTFVPHRSKQRKMPKLCLPWQITLNYSKKLRFPVLQISALRNSVNFPVAWKISIKAMLDISLTGTTGLLLSSLICHNVVGTTSTFCWHRHRSEQVQKSIRRKSHSMVNSPSS